MVSENIIICALFLANINNCSEIFIVFEFEMLLIIAIFQTYKQYSHYLHSIKHKTTLFLANILTSI